MALTRISRWYAVALMLIPPLVVGPAAAAQELYGSVVGTVQDNSGGLIPGQLP